MKKYKKVEIFGMSTIFINNMDEIDESWHIYPIEDLPIELRQLPDLDLVVDDNVFRQATKEEIDNRIDYLFSPEFINIDKWNGKDTAKLSKKTKIEIEKIKDDKQKEKDNWSEDKKKLKKEEFVVKYRNIANNYRTLITQYFGNNAEKDKNIDKEYINNNVSDFNDRQDLLEMFDILGKFNTTYRVWDLYWELI